MELKNEYTDEEISRIDEEFVRLKDKHYLDHAGATLYAASQIKGVCDTLTDSLFCNPHTSKTTEDLIDQVRYRILNFFNADPNDYTVIFTSGATGSLKTVAECFDFNGAGHFVYLHDNHTSVLGMREVVRTSNIVGISRDDFFNSQHTEGKKRDGHNSLVVFPAQCNFNGYKYDLSVIEVIQKSGISIAESNWHVCLDAASYVATSFLDLNRYHPDFVTVSFYKIFGYPTGLGALLVSKRGAAVLNKSYYGGGTVKIAMTSQNWHQKRDSLHERFEDGTIPFLSIISLLKGFDTLERLVPASVVGGSTMHRISEHTFLMAKYFHDKLVHLKHTNEQPLARLYNDTKFDDVSSQGGIVNFNLLHNDGTYVGFAEVACMASLHNIYLRTGCFCNPGACQRVLNLSDDDVKKHFQAGHICGDANDLIDGQPTGSVRISVGYMTQKSNLDAVLEMIVRCYVRRKISPIDRHNVLVNYKCDVPITMKPIPKVGRVSLLKICIYPIKSAAAFKISTHWPVGRKGLKFDRDWVIVNGNGVALTQKNEPKLCTLRPEIDMNKNIMRLRFPYMTDFETPLSENESKGHLQSASMCQTKVCGDRIQGWDCGDSVGEWLSEALCTSGLRLLHQSDKIQRQFKNGVTKEISLANQAQYLLVNVESVRWLADKVEDWEEVEYSTDSDLLEGVIDRFRANLIITADPPLVENQWTNLKICGTSFKVEGPCTRCQMICIDQATGEKTVEPLRTIAREFQGKMRFGVYLSHLSSKFESVLSCGEVSVDFQ